MGLGLSVVRRVLEEPKVKAAFRADWSRSEEVRHGVRDGSAGTSAFFDRLPRPWPITPDELRDIFWPRANADSTGFDAAYEQLIVNAVSKLWLGTPRLYPVLELRGVCEPKQWHHLRPQSKTYTSDSGLGVTIVTLAAPDDMLSREPAVDLGAWIVGNGFSPRASRRAIYQTRRLLRSAAITLSMTGHFHTELVSAANPDYDPSAPRAPGWDSVFDPRRWPTIAKPKNPEPDQQTGLDEFLVFLALYWMDDTKAGETWFRRRLRNAIRLLVEADRAKHPIVSVALSCAALEAMLIQHKKPDITETLARNATTLLEPDKLERLRAQSGVKRLYDARSRLMHGEETEATGAETAMQARLLAAGVLKGMMYWVRYMAEPGKRKTADEFFSELKAADVQAQEMVGIPRRLAGCLPRKE